MTKESAFFIAGVICLLFSALMFLARRAATAPAVTFVAPVSEPPPSRDDQPAPPIPNTPEEVASDPPSAPKPDDTKTEKTMSLKDDASAFAAKGESILASAGKAIETAVAKARAELDTFYQNQIADLKADADAAKTIYENTITDLQSKIEAMSAPAADAQ